MRVPTSVCLSNGRPQPFFTKAPLALFEMSGSNDVVKDVEAYVSSQSIDSVVKNMVVSCLTSKPPNVTAHM